MAKPESAPCHPWLAQALEFPSVPTLALQPFLEFDLAAAN